MISMRIISITILLSLCTASLGAVRSLFLPKPQGFYENHYLRPHDDYKKRCQQPTVGSAMLAYRQSFKSEGIADLLFGGTQLSLTGSAVPNRSPRDLLADNFGFAQNFKGKLCFAPQLKTLTLDFFYHINLPSWCESLFVEIGAPLVHTRWDLHTGKSIIDEGEQLFPACYMSSNPATVVETTSNIPEAFSGNYLFGQMQTPWKAGIIPFESIHKTRLADLSVALGADFYRGEHCAARAALLTIVPTSNKTKPLYVFNPVIGNADRWEFGLNLMGTIHYEWCTHHEFDFYIIGNMTHPFSNHQQRTFDFIGKGPLSRYSLLEEIIITKVNGADTFSTYANNMINGVNFATRCTKVSCIIQGDATLHAAYRYGCGSYEIGYNYWGRSSEHLTIVPKETPCDIRGHTYIFKGTADLCTPAAPQQPFFLTLCDLDLSSATVPASHVHTLFAQTGYHWETTCVDKAILFGLSVELGDYGCHKALYEWGVWTEFNFRF